MAHILQGLSYKVCSTMPPILFAFGLPILVLGYPSVYPQQLVVMLQVHVRFVFIVSSMVRHMEKLII